MRYKCIYCLQEKDESEFNREHVVPRMMGTYNQNGMVLSEHQVCKDCNSYFSTDLESTIALDSYEGLLRFLTGTKKAHEKREIGTSALCIEGQNNIFKGMSFHASTSATPNNNCYIQLETDPLIGIIRDIEKPEYDYYSLDTLPKCDKKTASIIRRSKNPIMFNGYSRDQIDKALKEKGYILPENIRYIDGLSISEITDTPEIITAIRIRLNEHDFRVAAKTVFNFLCYAYGRETALSKDYNEFRDFIRNENSNAVSCKVVASGLSNIPSISKDCHIVGLSWIQDKNHLYLGGFVSWFNSLTFLFKICPIPLPKGVIVIPMSKLKISVCDNKAKGVIIHDLYTTLPWTNE